MHALPAESTVPEARWRLLVRLGRWTALFVPPVFVVSLLLVTSLTSYSHGTPTPVRVLSELWEESLEADEEIFILLGLVLWTASWSYAFASTIVLRGRASVPWLLAFVGAAFITPFAAGLEQLWSPNRALGNGLLALGWSTTFVTACWFHLRRLTAARASSTS